MFLPVYLSIKSYDKLTVPGVCETEIQFNLLPLFCVLGQEGYQLHRELRDIEYMFDDNRTCSKVMASFDLRGLADDSLSPPSLNQVVDDVCFSDESAPAGETNGISLTFKNGFFPKEFDEKPAEMINEVTSDINQELEATKALIPEADLVHSAAPNRLTFEARYDLLKAVSDKNLTVEKLFRAVIEYGSTAASDKPRDVATFVCLYLFFSFILKESKGSGFLMRGHGVPTASDLVAYSHQCLLRCLKISNQAISMGMTGWLEYGSSSEVDRLHGCPFAVLRQLTYDFGSLDQWNEAECVCLALVARCEQFLPPFHPTTLVSLMDLAGVSSMLKKGSTSARLMSRVADRLSAYLAEAEMSLVAHLANSAMPVKKPGETVFQLQHTGGTFTKLHAFVTLFRHQLSKNMMMANGEVANVTALTCHCFVADSISVLANCATATKSILGFPSDVASVDGVSFWRLAFDHYQIAFDGFSRRNGLGDPSTLNSAYGVARCFREFGETEKALEFLSLVVSYTVDTTEVFGSDSERGKDKLPFRIEEDEKESPLRSFMPPFSIQNIMIDNHNAAMHTSSACCLWLMAILSLDQAPTEENRERSFKYLHAASISLQSALDRMCGIDDEVAKAFCIRFLGIIEDEAIRISEPTYE